jgi:hypothetical protein
VIQERTFQQECQITKERQFQIDRRCWPRFDILTSITRYCSSLKFQSYTIANNQLILNNYWMRSSRIWGIICWIINNSAYPTRTKFNNCFIIYLYLYRTCAQEQDSSMPFIFFSFWYKQHKLVYVIMS